MKMTLPRSLILAGVAAVAFTGCLQEGPGVSTSHASAAASAPVAPVVNRAGLPDFSALVEQVGPAVVNISVTSVQKMAADEGGIDSSDPFFDFFRRFGIPVPGMPGGQAQPRVTQGVGSGFIVSPDGYVLTNAHVVDGATEVTVKMTDKREFKAKVIGSDKRTDVALIKIDGKNLPTVRLGDAEHAKVGEWVIAVGSPFGFDNTVTAGIISAKSRRLPDETYVPFLQTDVAINPGNSGGPLFNLNGDVIGINSQIYSRSGGFMGISFAIPIDVAIKVKDQLQKHGKVSRGRLGVLLQEFDDDLAQNFGLAKAKGALVAQVEAGGPAAHAGLESGDIILSVDGQPINEVGDLQRLIGDRRPGEKVKLGLWRNKANKEISVTLAEQSEGGIAALPGDAPGAGNKLGADVRALSSAEAAQLGVPGGVVIERASGVAASAGLRRGDAILAVNNQRVSTPAELKARIDAAGSHFALLIQRGNQRQFLTIRLK